MLQIDYESEGFAAGSGVLNGTGVLQVTWGDLLWAAVTVGRPNRQYVFQHGLASKYEALFRLSLVRMSLEQSGPRGSRLRRTTAARTLDPSEKGAVNYFLGLAVAKLFADKCLDAPWMLHLDVFRPQLNVQLAGRSRPDLVGQTTARAWIALECKGRLSPPSATAKDKAKQQAERITRINGAAPSVNIGCVTFFRDDVIRFFWRDPRPEPLQVKVPIEIVVPDEFWGVYYSPVLALFRDSRQPVTTRPDGTVSARDESLDLEISIEAAVLRLLDAGRWEEARHVAERIPTDQPEARQHRDGVRVVAGPSWPERFRDAGAEAR